jgi:hypothetical protein
MTTSSLRFAIIALSWSIVGHSAIAAADGPVRHSVYQSAPPPDRYSNPSLATNSTAQSAPPSTFAPAGNYPGGLAPPPELMNGARNAVDDATSALRRGLENGMQQANQQLSGSTNPLFENARSAGAGLTAQAQEIANGVSRQLGANSNDLRNLAEPFVRTADVGQPRTTTSTSGVEPPPWPGAAPNGGSAPNASNGNANGWSSTPAPRGPNNTGTLPPFSPAGTNAAAQASAPREQSLLSSGQNWSVLGNNTAAPPLLTPSLTPPPGNAGVTGPLGASPPASNSTFGTAPAGSNFPNANPPGNSTQGPLFPEYPSGGTLHNPLTDPGAANAAARRLESNSGFVPANSNATGATDPFSRPPVLGGPSAPNGANVSSIPPSFTGGAGQPATPLSTAPPLGGTPPNGVSSTLSQIGTTSAQTRAPATTSAQRPATEGVKQATEESQKPWVPLVLTMLGLIGSVSANFFLGWSYMDARQKYQALVRKTADKFRRAADAA